MIEEKLAKTSSGYSVLTLLLLGLVLAILGLVFLPIPVKAVCALALIIMGFMCIGFFMVNPNQARVLQLFGRYVGSEMSNGLRWANPFYTKAKVSLRVRNFESNTLKVNDSTGNPVDIAAVVVWKVIDTAEAMFEVDDYENFVNIQSEAALRNLATTHPYDSFAEDGDGDDGLCLRGNPDQIAGLLKTEVQNRLSKAGVEVIEARISHLAYAPEIASAMLQRQQAAAIIAARRKIVDGAVGMVELALEALAQKGVVELDEERKAAMVSNLLVVLCGDSHVQPVVNTGSLYT